MEQMPPKVSTYDSDAGPASAAALLGAAVAQCLFGLHLAAAAAAAAAG